MTLPQNFTVPSILPLAQVYHFHVNLFAVPSCTKTTMPLTLRGRSLTQLTSSTGLPLTYDVPLEVTWEAAAGRLEDLGQMIFEPDGSFVWSGVETGDRWQVDGHLFEFQFAGEPLLHRVELHGHCPPGQFDQLLVCAGWPKTTLVFELVLDGVALDEANFRRWVASAC